MRSHLLLPLALVVSLSTGCATIVQGEHQSVPIDTDPSGAVVYVNGVEMGQTPTVLSLDRGDDHVVELERDGYAPVTLRLDKSLDFVPAVVGNLFSWGIFGFAVDFVSGAAYELDPEALRSTLEAEGMSLAPSEDPDRIRVVLLPVEVVEAATAAE